MNIITITKKGNSQVLTYSIQKDYDKWKVLPKKVTVTQKGNRVLPKKAHTVTQKGTYCSPKGDPQKIYTKDIYTIDIYTKDIEGIITDFNEVFCTTYKLTTRKTKELITARLNEGFTLEDFKKVHRTMLRHWGADEKMVRYLRPITLYSTKFESYLNIRVSTTKLGEHGVKAFLIGQDWLRKNEVQDDKK